MTRTPQPEGARGSLKWIQRAVNDRPELLDGPLLSRLSASEITWLSPLQSDGYAEYRDGAFLDLAGVGDLRAALAEFWPARGPQWDALGRSDQNDLILVEAKAHVAEMFSPASAASAASRAKIERALDWTAERLGAKPKAAWIDVFYQYANRLAHLTFLRSHGRPAWLAMVSFTGDADISGPNDEEAWNAAYAVIHHVMGLRADHPLARYVVHLHPNVADLASRS